jgi:hypothetical protein
VSVSQTSDALKVYVKSLRSLSVTLRSPLSSLLRNHRFPSSLWTPLFSSLETLTRNVTVVNTFNVEVSVRDVCQPRGHRRHAVRRHSLLWRELRGSGKEFIDIRQAQSSSIFPLLHLAPYPTTAYPICIPCASGRPAGRGDRVRKYQSTHRLREQRLPEDAANASSFYTQVSG